MGLIYTPAGRAREYSSLALNVYTGCAHGCKYCYVPDAIKIDKDRFHNHIAPRMLTGLRREAFALRGTKEPVLLCFTCDPYQPIEEELHITRTVLKTLSEFMVPFQVLTKAGILPQRDFGLYFDGCAFATTLTLLDEEMRKEWEPHAAPFEDRISNLKEAKKAGIRTWVSLEPVIDPKQTLEIIGIVAPYVDQFRIGKMNHLEADIDWGSFARRAVALCEKLKKDYYIKEDLRKYL